MRLIGVGEYYESWDGVCYWLTQTDEDFRTCLTMKEM